MLIVNQQQFDGVQNRNSCLPTDRASPSFRLEFNVLRCAGFGERPTSRSTLVAPTGPIGMSEARLGQARLLLQNNNNNESSLNLTTGSQGVSKFVYSVFTCVLALSLFQLFIIYNRYLQWRCRRHPFNHMYIIIILHHHMRSKYYCGRHDNNY